MRLVVFLSLAIGCGIAHANEPVTVGQALSWQRQIFKSHGSWPRPYPTEYRVRLGPGRSSQRLVAVEGGARSGEYILFRRQGRQWKPISEPIHQAHHPIEWLRHRVGGWHDFRTYVPLWGSGGKDVLVSHYRWNGRQYKLIATQQGMWRDYGRFRKMAGNCPK